MKRHKITAFVSALFLLCSAVPTMGVFGADATEEKSLGVLKYQPENGGITITKCETAVETVEIPAEIDGLPVLKIGSTAFYNSKATSITIPEGVTEISTGAFWHAKNLTDIVLPSTLTTIESNAFNDCQSLENIQFPKKLNHIGANAFLSTKWMANEKEKNPFVTVNGILIDATAVVDNGLIALQETRDQLKQDYLDAKTWNRAGIMTNQVGYFPNLHKKATLVSDETGSIEYNLLDESGNVVYHNTSIPMGYDAESGDNVHVLDFSDFTTEGTYTLKAETGEESRAFEIGVLDNYSGLLYDSLNYFYQNRSGIAIEEQYITSGDAEALARDAGHLPDVAEIKNIRGYDASSGTQDVTGGWYDAGDHGKYVVNGGISLWLMQNQYERALLKGTAQAYQDGTMKLPENADGLPDLLNEARYEMEWMLKMIVQDGECQNMVYHKMHGEKWTALGLNPADDNSKRIILPPSTAATLNLAACGAQAYRLWKDLDPAFAEECLTASKNAYEAAKNHPDMYAPLVETIDGGGAYGDDNVTDEFYWAACELYATTGDVSYYNDLKDSGWAFRIASDLSGGEANGLRGSFDWGNTSALGSLTLLLNPDKLAAEENSALNDSLTNTANDYLNLESVQGYGLPFEGQTNANGSISYVWASNSFVTDNAIVMAYAYDLTQDAKYLNGVAGAMDYILGRNPMDNSYVTGYGVHSSQYPHHRWWAKELNEKFPKAPCGVMVGGANTGMEDDVIKRTDIVKGKTPPQKSYYDDIEAYSVNECAINWNTSLAWVTSYLCEQNGGIIIGQPSTGTQIPEIPKPESIPDEVVVNIPEGITALGEQIFGTNAAYVVEVNVPEGVTEIGKQAFFKCSNLQTVTLPETLELVGESAFANTPWLAQVGADSPLLIINGLLIDGTSAEGAIEIPDTVTSILGKAFYMNTKITSVSIPETVKTIGTSAFHGCENLASVSLPKSLETIGEKAFSDTALTALTVPESVKTIGDSAFVNCRSLLDATVLTKDATIGSEAFGWTSTFTSTGQYSYIFVDLPIDNFVLHCYADSTADNYATEFKVQTSYLSGSTEFSCGDVNADGVVDIADVLLLNQHLLGIENLTPEGRIYADTNGDNQINDTDALNILKSLVDLVTLPVVS